MTCYSVEPRERCCRDEPALDINGDIIDFPVANNNSASFKFKQKIIGQTGNGSTKGVKIMVPLRYLSNFWRTLEIPLINCDISLQLKWSRNNQNPTFQINDAKLYDPSSLYSNDTSSRRHKTP